MRTFFGRRLVEAAVLAASLLVCAAAARAQDQPTTEFESLRLPGWSFTPGVTIGALYDSNVSLTPPDVHKDTPSDNLIAIQPSAQVEFYNSRTAFSTGYTGVLRRYMDFTQLDDSDNRGLFSLRREMTRRVTLFVLDNYAQVSTTDQLNLAGVPFQRIGGRYNDFSGGVEARLSRTLDLASHFESTWVGFDHPENVVLIGGVVNGADTEVSRRFTDRVSVGGEYNLRFANLNSGTENLVFNEFGGTFHYRISDITTVDASLGGAYLIDRSRSLSRTGPYVKANIMHRASRATIGATYLKSYLPSLVFGGTNQSDEATAYVQMPVSKNRVYVQESIAWRRTDPFISTELPLSSIWIYNLVGYTFSRQFRIEGYYQFTGQDNKQVEGRILRHVAGVQFVVAQPMRILR
jgi:hypothetical protein